MPAGTACLVLMDPYKTLHSSDWLPGCVKSGLAMRQKHGTTILQDMFCRYLKSFEKRYWCERLSLCRRRRFKSGCEVNFARMLCGSLKSNGLADPFKNNEDDSFPEEQLPPPLQEHGPAAGDQLPKKGRQNEKPINEGPLHAGHPAHYHQQYQPHMQQHAASQHLHFPSYFDMWPAHAAAVSQAFGANLGLGANGMGVRGMRHHDQNGSAAATSHAGDAAASAFQSSINMSAYQMAGLPVLQPLSGMQSATAAAKPDAISVSAPRADSPPNASSSDAKPAAAAVAAAPSTEAAEGSAQPQQLPTGTAAPFTVLPQQSAAVGTTGIVHRPLQYPTPAGMVPSLFLPNMPANATQTTGNTAALPNGSCPGSFPFPPGMPPGDALPTSMCYSTAGDASRLAQSQLGLYAQHLPAFASAGNTAGIGGFFPASFAPNSNQAPSGGTAAASAAVDQSGVSSAAAGETGRKRKSPGSSQKKGPRGGVVHGDAGGPVIARRAANRPPPQVCT